MSAATPPPTLRVAVVIASLGRPHEVRLLLERLALQTLAPSLIVVSACSAADLPADLPPAVRVIFGPKGLTKQRNAGMELVSPAEHDVIVFFDDDFVPSETALAAFETLFSAHPDVVGANGLVLADGICTPGISHEEACAAIAAHSVRALEPPLIERELDGLYGCNMAFRVSAIGAELFDERLPLYGWQEDVDFSSRLTPRGRLVVAPRAFGVHRGVKGGRTSGVRFGWSQIVNPIYLMRKRSVSRAYALRLLTRNLLANHLRALAPEPWVDRLGRLRGNWLGLAHIASGRLEPEHVLNID